MKSSVEGRVDENLAAVVGKIDETPGLKLSVVLSNYNHASFLPTSLGAIVQQSYRPFEILIIDDASTDNSAEIIEEFARKESRIRFMRNERNVGAVANANTLLGLASGDYVYFMASDDQVMPGFFEKCMGALTRHPQAALCAARCRIVDGVSGSDVGCFPLERIPARDEYVSPADALRSFQRDDNWIMGTTTILRREAVLAAGGLIRELGAFCDGFLYMVLALKYGTCFIPEPLGMWRFMASGYAGAGVSNLDVSLEMWSHAVHLMRGKYGDLFPPTFVDVWEVRKQCHARLSNLNKLQKQQLAIVQRGSHKPNRIERLFATVNRPVIRLPLLILAGYFILRFPRAMWPMLMHRFRMVLGKIS